MGAVSSLCGFVRPALLALLLGRLSILSHLLLFKSCLLLSDWLSVLCWGPHVISLDSAAVATLVLCPEWCFLDIGPVEHRDLLFSSVETFLV